MFHAQVLGLVPFECIWKDGKIEVVQKLQGNIVNIAGVYNTIQGKLCTKCGNPYLFDDNCYEHYLHEHLEAVDGTFQLGHYFKKASMRYKKADDLLNEHIWNLKKNPEYAKPLAQALFLVMNHCFPLLREADLIVPVPNHQDDYYREAKAVALAKELGELYASNGLKTTVSHCIEKVKNVQLRPLNQHEREEAVEGMFKFNLKESVKEKKVILLDDVLTAGNVKGICSTLLKSQGAVKVWIMVLGRTL